MARRREYTIYHLEEATPVYIETYRDEFNDYQTPPGIVCFALLMGLNKPFPLWMHDCNQLQKTGLCHMTRDIDARIIPGTNAQWQLDCLLNGGVH